MLTLRPAIVKPNLWDLCAFHPVLFSTSVPLPDTWRRSVKKMRKRKKILAHLQNDATFSAAQTL